MLFTRLALLMEAATTVSPEFDQLATVTPPGYYAAFVIDPEGNNIEALFRETDNE